METNNPKSMTILGVFIFFGLFALGYLLSSSIIKSKEFERSVIVKGLSQKQYEADIVLWPIKFVTSSNDLNKMHNQIETNTKIVLEFLEKHNIKKEEINVHTPSILDNYATNYSNRNVPFRYLSNATINVYSKDVKKVRSAITEFSELSKKGIIFKLDDYDTRIEYMFTKLNEVKPEMIEESTRKAREVALKFAKDSKSKLGKIKKARQGQFSISNRDKNTPYIKTVRVVSTVEYYLSD